MSWLTGKQLETKILKNADPETRKAYGGVFSIDQLPFAIPQYPYFMIINTQSHNLPGEHWKTVFIDREKRAEVFDSLALPLSNILIRWLNRFTRSFSVNRLFYQHPLSPSCGAFSLYFVLNRLHNPKCVTDMFDTALHDNVTRVMKYYETLK